MKKLMMFGMGALLVGSFAMAADAENTGTTKTNESHNPITGTDTTTTTTEAKVKTPHGGTHKMKKEHKTKVKSDGSTTEKTTSEKSDDAPKN
jgi:hypothetical protein